jgi:hypothetical protein
MMTSRRQLLFAGLLASALLGAALPCAAQTVWFPLQTGYRWSYQPERGVGGTRTVEVKEPEAGDAYHVDFNGTDAIITLWYDIYLPEEGIADTWYRFDQDSWLHRDLNTCDDLRILSVTARDETVTTPAGEFTGCLRIEFGAGTCFYSGTFVEWWAPDVGRVKWTEGSFIGERTWVLTEYFTGQPAATFRRGDADGDGKVDVSDAIAVLSWLYLDGAAPGCADAADVNDDGAVDVSDGVAVLRFLFLDGTAPPAPGPQDCGEDPTKDELSCKAGACK